MIFMIHFRDGFTLLVWPSIVDWNCAALNLVAPASKVSPSSNAHSNVGFEGQGVHGARVDTLEGRQLLLVAHDPRVRLVTQIMN